VINPSAINPAGRPADLLDEVLASADPPPFALLRRPEATGGDVLEVLLGEVAAYDTLADIPVPDLAHDGARSDVLVLVPYRQIAERGFAGPDDGAPLLAMRVGRQQRVPLRSAVGRLPDTAIALSGSRFTPDDAAYADTVASVVRDRIGTGAGSNFVVRRSFVAEITDYTLEDALTFFSRLVQRENGAYWTFLAHTGDRTFVGATPERHVSVHDGTAVMNPISGTYRYPPSGPDLDGLMDFLADRKEIDELYMVVDEELKMMARVCAGRVRVSGPYLREMARVAHTEYYIDGRTELDPRHILRETMFAPTVTGSPLQSAARVIADYEPEGRGYYGGVVALIGQDADGGRTLDSSILIRTAEIGATGRLSIGVGATLVRHSDPLGEVAETRAKAAGLLAALEPEAPRRLGDHPDVRRALARRNDAIAGFWLSEQRSAAHALLRGERVLVVDAEDTFTAMLAHQLGALGLDVTVRRYDEPHDVTAYDLVVLGPGPGDPLDGTDPRIAHLQTTVERLLDLRAPFLAVCLSHQVVSARLGLPLLRRDEPNQGVQREIDLFGVPQLVGFYNTFNAVSDEVKIDAPGVGVVEVARDATTGEVHALRGPHFRTTQFHPESVLTCGGPEILATAVLEVLAS
jgi:phenazine biosynthesis protein phzE